MDSALNKYRVLYEAGSWSRLTAYQQQIVALNATVASLQRSSRKPSKPRKPTKGTPSPTKKKKEKKQDGKNKQEGRCEYPAWKLQKPKEPSQKSLTQAGQKYFWCPHHKLWSAHKPEDCKLGKKGKEDKPRLQINRGHVAVDELEDDLASL